jgi:hypothetical protein
MTVHSASVSVPPVRLRPVLVTHRSIPSAMATSVVQVTCGSDLGGDVRYLDDEPIGPHQWLLVDLTAVTSATHLGCRALVTALDRVSPDQFCIVAVPRPPWVGEMLPHRARRVTFLSVGDALQMLVLAEEGFGGSWLARDLLRRGELDLAEVV